MRTTTTFLIFLTTTSLIISPVVYSAEEPSTSFTPTPAEDEDENAVTSLSNISSSTARNFKTNSIEEEGNDDGTGDDSANKIRHCTCSELNECRTKVHQKFKPCAEKCLEKLYHASWNEEAGRKCLLPKDQKTPACFENLRNKT